MDHIKATKSGTSRPDRWAVSTSSKLTWRVLGEDTVVYHHGSADTHKLSPVGVAALKALQDQPLTVQELGGRVGKTLDLEVDDELLRYMEKLIVRLDELGLVEPAL